MERPTISTMPDECLQIIFLNLPIVQRIEVRKVCKRWRRISDDCWRTIRGIVMNEKLPICYQVLEKDRIIYINTSKATFAIGFVKRCAEYVTSVVDTRREPDFSILPAMTSCNRIEALAVALSSTSHDEEFDNVLSANQKIRSLTVKVRRHSPLLNSITRNDNRNLLLEKIGEKINLEVLNITIDYPDTELDFMLKLVNLRSLRIHVPFMVTQMSDKFLESLSKSCVHLEVLKIRSCCAVTDSGLLAVSTLPNLKELFLGCAPNITDQYLINFAKIESLKITHSQIGDPGTIALLRNSQNLKYLDLRWSKITVESIKVAIDEATKRTNNICLKFNIKHMGIDVFELDDFPPLLQLIC